MSYERLVKPVWRSGLSSHLTKRVRNKNLKDFVVVRLIYSWLMSLMRILASSDCQWICKSSHSVRGLPAKLVGVFWQNNWFRTLPLQFTFQFLLIQLGGNKEEARLKTIRPKDTQDPLWLEPNESEKNYYEMSYYRYITGVYKSYWPELNRTLRSSSSPRHIPQPVPSENRIIFGSKRSSRSANVCLSVVFQAQIYHKGTPFSCLWLWF